MIDKLHFISQESETTSHIDSIKQALEAGCKWIQLRVKNQSEETVKQYALEAKKLCDNYDAKLIINDFPQIAKDVDAYGVHLGLLDMPVADARKIVGDKLIIGGTANTFENILLRVKSGADYVGLGPFRFTTTKENLSPVLGLEGYQSILNNLQQAGVNIPIIAIGGIESNDISSLIEAGVHGIAISGTIAKAEDKPAIVSELYALLNQIEVV